MNPNDLGKKLLVEENQKLEVNTFLRLVNVKLKETLIRSEFQANGLKVDLTISKTGFGGVRYWFKCPICNGRVGTLFTHPISLKMGCRGCLGLKYRERVK